MQLRNTSNTISDEEIANRLWSGVEWSRTSSVEVDEDHRIYTGDNINQVDE